MRKILFPSALILSIILRIPQSGGEYAGLVVAFGSVISIFLLARTFAFKDRSFAFAEICALFLAISPWHIFLSKYQDKNLSLLITTLGIYIITRFFKKHSLLIASVFLVIVNFSGHSLEKSLGGFSNTQVPIWLIDEQRREHGNFFDHTLVVLAHNKVVNYTLSFLDHYTQHFHGDFLFISGDVRKKFGEFGQMYPFDFIFITLALIFIIKNPKGWGIILLWLILSPIPSALDFQPPNALKAYLMIIPLIILSSFGGSYFFKKLGKIIHK